MKKKLLFLLPLLLMPLTACDMSALANKSNDEEEKETSDEGAGEKLSFDKDEVFNKLKNYGKTTGFDITFDTKTISDGEETNTSMEVAMKDNMVWLIQDGAYTGAEYNETSVTLFTSEDGVTFDTTEYGPEQLEDKTPEEFFEDLLDTYTSFFYFADVYKSLGLTKVRNMVYANTEAAEYSFEFHYGGAGATYKTYIDDELGINLYFFAETIDAEGAKESTEFKVKTFLSGDQVKKPNINNN